MTDNEFALALNDARQYVQNYAESLLISRDDVEDLVQDALERAWKHRHTFNPGRSSLKTWLVYLLRNIVKDQFRADKVRRDTMTTLSIEDLIDVSWDADDMNESITFTPDYDTRIGLEQALIKLGGIHEKVLRLCFIGGFTFGEVANKLQLSRRKIRRILETGLRRMKLILHGARR